MKKRTLIALLAATVLLSSCDDATKEKAQATLDEVTQQAGEMKEKADAATQDLVTSAENAGKEAQAALDNGIADTVQQKVDGHLATAQEKLDQASNMKVSDIINFTLGNDSEADKEGAEQAEGEEK